MLASRSSSDLIARLSLDATDWHARQLQLQQEQQQHHHQLPPPSIDNNNFFVPATEALDSGEAADDDQQISASRVRFSRDGVYCKVKLTVMSSSSELSAAYRHFLPYRRPSLSNLRSFDVTESLASSSSSHAAAAAAAAAAAGLDSASPSHSAPPSSRRVTLLRCTFQPASPIEPDALFLGKHPVRPVLIPQEDAGPQSAASNTPSQSRRGSVASLASTSSNTRLNRGGRNSRRDSAASAAHIAVTVPYLPAYSPPDATTAAAAAPPAHSEATPQPPSPSSPPRYVRFKRWSSNASKSVVNAVADERLCDVLISSFTNYDNSDNNNTDNNPSTVGTWSPANYRQKFRRPIIRRKNSAASDMSSPTASCSAQPSRHHHVYLHLTENSHGATSSLTLNVILRKVVKYIRKHLEGEDAYLWSPYLRRTRDYLTKSVASFSSFTTASDALVPITATATTTTTTTAPSSSSARAAGNNPTALFRRALQPLSTSTTALAAALDARPSFSIHFHVHKDDLTKRLSLKQMMHSVSAAAAPATDLSATPDADHPDMLIYTVSADMARAIVDQLKEGLDVI
ncbi:hypothetical protein RI367_003501 [Sorochytrium milnesiophthora]